MKNYIQRLQEKIQIVNYTFSKNNLIIELEDSSYNLDLQKKVISHVGGRYSELIHNNLIKEL